MEPSQKKKFGVKNFYSKFFHGKSRPKENPCKTSVLRFDRIIRNYKKAMPQENPLSLRHPIFLCLLRFDEVEAPHRAALEPVQRRQDFLEFFCFSLDLRDLPELFPIAGGEQQ